MRKQPVKIDDTYGWRMYAADFECTTGKYSETESHVWSFQVDEVGKYEPEIYGSIEDFFAFCENVLRGTKKRIYFHNLKFDGSFILWHLVNVMGYKTKMTERGAVNNGALLGEKECSYLIDDMGLWYYIVFRIGGVIVEVRDSLKILPFTLKEIGESFCTKYKKTTMEYDDKTSLADCTEQDIEYLKNDVLVLSEALSFIMKLNYDGESPFQAVRSLTIGGACLQEFKRLNYGDNHIIMPRLDTIELEDISGSSNMDEYVRKSYRGGFCYVNEKIAGKTVGEGFTVDVNSLYPYAMSTELSGASYPVGRGVYMTGKPSEKDDALDSIYYFIRIRVSFELKDGYVPMIQIKNSFMYMDNEYLKSSCVMNYRTGKYQGKPKMVELTLTKDDWFVFQKHYKILKIEYLDYVKFYTGSYIFDTYIKEFAEIKKNSTGPIRALAKVFQNTIYGQMGKGSLGGYKVLKDGAEDGEGEKLNFGYIEQTKKNVVNIAIASAIAAKARRYQLETIQNNIDLFCYSDTDSLHCVGKPEQFVGRVDSKEYGAYKIESTWKRGKFVRQKTYIEEFENGFINICAAGMTEEQKEIFRNEHKFEDFGIGLTINRGKLKPKNVIGGVILEEVGFTIK